MQRGQRLGNYLILSLLAVGGVGEVYRARDTKLGRDVAIKVLRKASAFPANQARIAREAQVLARLNHPCIAAIYGEEQGAVVMELVEGATLAQRISRGPLAFDEALKIARQIADALQYVHERGLIHRDMKPSNIMLTRGGTVKLIDFGLSRAAKIESARLEDPEQSPTVSLSMTRAGVILGTSGYMSPEQARGQAVDRSVDVWAFGVVFYEMLTGSRLFGGQTISDRLASILTQEPHLDRVPYAVRKLLQRCLCKDPRERFRDIGDVRLLLEDIDIPRSPGAGRRLLAAILSLFGKGLFPA